MQYKQISQKPYCCVPACVQMILQRRKLPMLAQADIAYDLGVILPPKDKHLLPRSHSGPRPKAGWGTRINLPRFSLTAFFEQRGYPLQVTFYPAKKFSSPEWFKKFLLNNVRQGNDLLTCFNYPQLYHQKGSWGHASLIEAVKKKCVTLYDPLPKRKEARKVSLNDLFAASKNHHYGGVWVIKGMLQIQWGLSRLVSSPTWSGIGDW